MKSELRPPGDVTDELHAERERLHEAARRREAELQAFIDSSNAIIFIKDLAGRLLSVNRACAELWGRPSAELLGKTDDEIFAPGIARAFQAEDRRVIDSGAPIQYERTFAEGERERSFVVVKFPLRDASGAAYAIGCIATETTEHKEVEARLLRESRINETLSRLGASFATELDEQKLLQLITDEATSLTGADFGSFFFNVKDDRGGSFMLYTLSGASKEQFAGFPLPRATPLFAPTFRGEGITRLDDVRKDPRYGKWGPQPKGHLPVVSYLAVPVVARSGEVLGGLFFAHREPGRFTEQHAEIVKGIAAHAAVALENARLYGALRKSEEAANAAYRAAAAADRRKDEFLAVLGHELRNPLAPITTALHLLRLRGDARGQREIAIIERQVQHLSRLVDDLLDISRIIRGKIELDREPLELAAAVARGIEMASPLVEQKRHHLTVRVPRAGMRVLADPLRLAQVISNLLTNAAKYTDAGGHIDVAAALENGQVVLRVRDDGRGIPADVLPTVFDPFVQGARAVERAQGGLGLGLTLVRSLVELHGGTVEAHSDGQGKGSELVVRLPPYVVGTSVAPEADEPSLDAEPGSGRRILVVDDNEDAADTLANALRHVGHVVEVAYDPAQALARAPSFQPEIALLDIGLPVMDGYELGQRLRALAGGAGLRLIAVTGYGQENDRQRSRESRFDAHLVKPVDLSELLRALAPA